MLTTRRSGTLLQEQLARGRGKGYNSLTMKKVPALIVMLVLSAITTLSALDIYVNDVHWHSYADEALDALITEIPADDNPPSLPFALLLPLMDRADEMHLFFNGGDARLTCTAEELEDARLIRINGKWSLSWDDSHYKQPRRADLYGQLLEQKRVLIWAEPGLIGFKKQILIWSSLHKVDLKYREMANMDDELIHRRLTGEEQPDLVLRFQSSREAVLEEENVAYLLRSVKSRSGSPERLILPRGERFHPELFISLLHSQSRNPGSPLHPLFSTENLMKTRKLYMDLILNRKIIEKNSLPLQGDEHYYPARSFPKIPGDISSLPSPDGKGSLPPRILPLQLKSPSGEFPAYSLQYFLRLPGIQYSLISSSGRQLPARTEILEGRELSPEENKLYREWCSGYVLSRENKSFIQKLNDLFPDLYRAGGVLP